MERDGEAKRYLWEDLWMPAEDDYIRVQQPIKRADWVIDGSGDKARIADFMVML